MRMIVLNMGGDKVKEENGRKGAKVFQSALHYESKKLLYHPMGCGLVVPYATVVTVMAMACLFVIRTCLT